MGSINRQQGDVYRQVANFGHSPAQIHGDSPAGNQSRNRCRPDSS
jgi:hypothetical protein